MRLQRNRIEDFADEPGGRRLVRVNLFRMFTFNARQVPRIDDRRRIRAETCIEAFGELRAVYSDKIEQIPGGPKRAIQADGLYPVSDYFDEWQAMNNDALPGLQLACACCRI